jgi:3-dehydroquinate dehydratase-1
MSRPIAIFRTNSAALTVGEAPRVVGTLSSLVIPNELPGDIVELRLDRVSERTGWLEQCAAIQARGKPVLLTPRLRSEGGLWDSDDQRRLEIYQSALRQLAAVDVELSSAFCPAVAEEARKLQKACVVSYHHFQKTPPLGELRALVQRAQQIGSIVKISTTIQRESDVAALRGLLEADWTRPLCVIGMGPAWSHTRVLFAQLGSCLTYGYLDAPAAPGQLPAAELVRQLSRCP